MPSANGNRDFLAGSNEFDQGFHLLINGNYCMPVGFYPLLQSMGIGFYQVLNVAEVKVSNE